MSRHRKSIRHDTKKIKNKIINTLVALEIKENMLAFIKNFLKNRHIQVRINGHLSNPTIIQNGIPQGSAISVTLFLIGINEVIKSIKPPIQGNLFADDLTLTCSGKNINTTIELLHAWMNY